MRRNLVTATRRTMHKLVMASSACLLVAADGGERELPNVDDEPEAPQAEDTRSNELRTQMETLNRGYQDAYNRNDPQALARLYTDDAIIVTPEGRELRGRSAIASYFETEFERQALRLTFQPVESGGRGDVGWQYGSFTLEARPRPATRSNQRNENEDRDGNGNDQRVRPPTMEGHYVVVTRHEAARGQIRLQVAHPGTGPTIGPEGPIEQRPPAGERD